MACGGALNFTLRLPPLDALNPRLYRYPMKPNKHQLARSDTLFDRVAAILEEARGNVVRAVNSNMVLANWLIGREIVQELQGGDERAAYGKKVIEDLAARLTERYGKGYSEQSLQNFRRFYLAYAERVVIPSPVGRESDEHLLGAAPLTVRIPSPAGRELPQAFSPQLSWSHYRALMRVDNVLKCFLLIDLKMGKLTHGDIGQMDGYVRLYEDQFKIPGDNPTIGLLLCADKSEAVAKYSILNEGKQIFASKYLPNLPSEEQLRLEIARERRLIEESLQERAALPDN